jgi:hypothetical protein
MWDSRPSAPGLEVEAPNTTGGSNSTRTLGGRGEERGGAGPVRGSQRQGLTGPLERLPLWGREPPEATGLASPRAPRMQNPRVSQQPRTSLVVRGSRPKRRISASCPWMRMI